MLTIEDIGVVIVIWGVTALIFRDWVARFDLTLRERQTGDYVTKRAVEERGKLVEKTGRIVLAAGLVVFAIGAGLQFAHIS